MSTGLGLLGASGLSTDAQAQSPLGSSSITANFNGTPIRGGDFIWFSSVLKVQGLGPNPATVGFTGSISFVVEGTCASSVRGRCRRRRRTGAADTRRHAA